VIPEVLLYNRESESLIDTIYIDNTTCLVRFPFTKEAQEAWHAFSGCNLATNPSILWLY